MGVKGAKKQALTYVEKRALENWLISRIERIRAEGGASDQQVADLYFREMGVRVTKFHIQGLRTDLGLNWQPTPPADVVPADVARLQEDVAALTELVHETQAGSVTLAQAFDRLSNRLNDALKLFDSLAARLDKLERAGNGAQHGGRPLFSRDQVAAG